MKHIKFILTALVAVFVTLGSTSVYAQEDNNRDANGYVVRGPYLTNGGGSNWFVGVGGGINTTFAKGVVPFSEFTIANNWAAEAFIGKWFTPTIGARVGYRGVMNNFGYDTDKYFSNVYANGKQVRTGYVHGDLMWNLSNAIGGYKETRFYDIVPYVSAGYLGINNGSTDNKVAIGAGIYNEFRLSQTVNLFLDLSMNATENPVHLRNVADNKPVVSGQIPVICRGLYMPTATFGITINLGKKKNFDRYSSVAPVAVPFTLDEYNALNERVVAMTHENDELKNKLAECQNQKADTVFVAGETQVLIGSTIITFAIGSDELIDVEREKVEMFAKTFVEGEGLVQIVGSADSKTGTEKRNTTLSQRRAEIVRDVLVKNGIAESRITLSSTFDATDDPETSRSAIITLTVN